MLSICNDTVHYCENKCTVLFYSASNTELQCILRQCEFRPNLLQYVWGIILQQTVTHVLQDCTQPKNAFALTAKNYVFYRYCKRLQVAETSKKSQYTVRHFNACLQTFLPI